MLIMCEALCPAANVESKVKARFINAIKKEVTGAWFACFFIFMFQSSLKVSAGSDIMVKRNDFSAEVTRTKSSSVCDQGSSQLGTAENNGPKLFSSSYSPKIPTYSLREKQGKRAKM